MSYYDDSDRLTVRLAVAAGLLVGVFFLTDYKMRGATQPQAAVRVLAKSYRPSAYKTSSGWVVVTADGSDNGREWEVSPQDFDRFKAPGDAFVCCVEPGRWTGIEYGALLVPAR